MCRAAPAARRLVAAGPQLKHIASTATSAIHGPLVLISGRVLMHAHTALFCFRTVNTAAARARGDIAAGCCLPQRAFTLEI